MIRLIRFMQRVICNGWRSARSVTTDGRKWVISAVSPLQRNCKPLYSLQCSAVSNGTQQKREYDASSITVLEGLEPVRKRPGMYIGSTGSKGLQQLCFELIDNGIDEVQAGHANEVDVTLHTDGSVTVLDNGRGIPVDRVSAGSKTALETVLTTLHAGGKFGSDGSSYAVSGGLHGVGLSVVNALSEWLMVEVRRDGASYMQAYENGTPVEELNAQALGDEDSQHWSHGTRIMFKPDASIFSTVRVDADAISHRMRELAYLNSQCTLRLRQEVSGSDNGTVDWRERVFYYPGGLVDYVRSLHEGATTLHNPIAFKREVEGVEVEGVLQWREGGSESLMGYANSIRTTDGGTHLEGLKSALTRHINQLARKAKLLKEQDKNLSGEHVREGLTAVLSVKVSQPEFEGQTKAKLGNPQVRKAVDTVAGEEIRKSLEGNKALNAIASRAIQASRAAEAAKRAREVERKRYSVLQATALPGKLSDCSGRNTDQATELFVVEGDSAGGSAKQARDRRFQAILPLRGKILNVEKSTDSALYKNEEISNLITALGLGKKGETLDRSKLRYDRIIILTDADSDGAHIRTLLLTFLYRYQPEIFSAGMVHMAVPPLYKVTAGKREEYCYNDEELSTTLAQLNAKHSVQRFKGLGEMMPAQLWQTTMDPSARRLMRLTVTNAKEADRIFKLLMGDVVNPRKDFISNECHKVSQVDV